VHAIHGRLRIRVPAVKRNADRAAELARRLRLLDGVREVVANPTTANVLVVYDPPCRHDSIVAWLRETGYLDRPVRVPSLRPTTPTFEPGVSAAARDLAGELVVHLARATMQIALRRMVRALI
jgi:hypothetical protein